MKNIPKPTELNPRLAELETKRTNLYAEKTAKVAEAAIIRARIQDSPSTGNSAENRVRAILGEPLLAETAPDMSRLEALLAELSTINTALGKLDGMIQIEKAKASRLVCDEVRPEVTKLGKAYAKAFLALHSAQQDYHEYMEQVQDSGASIGSLPHVFISGLGSAKDRSGTFFYGIRDFVESGYLSPSEMPKAFK